MLSLAYGVPTVVSKMPFGNKSMVVFCNVLKGVVCNSLTIVKSVLNAAGTSSSPGNIEPRAAWAARAKFQDDLIDSGRCPCWVAGPASARRVDYRA